MYLFFPSDFSICSSDLIKTQAVDIIEVFIDIKIEQIKINIAGVYIRQFYHSFSNFILSGVSETPNK